MRFNIRTFLAGCALAACASSVTAGPYDGIWQMGGGPFISVNQNGASFLAVHLPASLGYWEAFFGSIDVQGTASVSLLLSPYLTSYSATVTFLSPTSATIRVNTCNPSVNCILKSGQSAALQKIY